MSTIGQALTEQRRLEAWLRQIGADCAKILQGAADDSVRYEIQAERNVWDARHRNELWSHVNWHKKNLSRCRRISDPIAKAVALLEQHYGYQQLLADVTARAQFADGSGAQRSQAATAAVAEIGAFPAWLARLQAHVREAPQSNVVPLPPRRIA